MLKVTLCKNYCCFYALTARRVSGITKSLTYVFSLTSETHDRLISVA